MKTEQWIDDIYPPFSEKRKEIRKAWSKYMRLVRVFDLKYISWDEWLLKQATIEIAPDLPF